MSNLKDQKPPKLTPQAGHFSGNPVSVRKQGPKLMDNGVGAKKPTTKND